MRTHNLKTHPEYFQEVIKGRKKFELRKDDRGFSVGDILCLEEYSPVSKQYTGKEYYVKVSYIFRGGVYGLDQNMVIMSIDEID